MRLHFLSQLPTFHFSLEYVSTVAQTALQSVFCHYVLMQWEDEEEEDEGEEEEEQQGMLAVVVVDWFIKSKKKMRN